MILDMRRMDRILDIDEQEPVRGRRARRHRRHAPGRDDEGGPQHPHRGRRLQRVDPGRSPTSFFGSGPSNLYGGHALRQPDGDGVGHPHRRPRPHRLRGRRPRLVQRRGPRPVDARGRARLPGLQGLDGRLHQVLREALPVARARRTLPVTGTVPGLPGRPGPAVPLLHARLPVLARLGRRRPADLGGGHRVHRPPPVQHVRARPQVRDGAGSSPTPTARSRTCCRSSRTPRSRRRPPTWSATSRS